MRARMLSLLWLAAALALAGGCVTVPAPKSGIDMGSTNSPMNPNGTKFSRFWQRQTDKLEALNKKPAPNGTPTGTPNADFYVTMAVAQEQSGNAIKAEELYQKALDIDSKSVATLSAYAHFEDRRGHLIAATKLYKKALAKHPEEASIYNDLGLCYQRRGMLNDSVAMLRKATRLQPERPLYHNNLASALVDSDRNDEALAQLMAVNPPAVAHYNLGCLLHRKGNDALAVDNFQQAIATDPNLTAAQQWLARLGPQPSLGLVEDQIARRQRPLQPVQVELGEPSDAVEVRVGDSAVPAVQSTAPPTSRRGIPAQAVSTPTVRQRPIAATVNEAAPPTQSGRVLQPAAPPVDEAMPLSQQPVDPFAPPEPDPAAESLPVITVPNTVVPSTVAPNTAVPNTVAPSTAVPNAAAPEGYGTPVSRIAPPQVQYPHYSGHTDSPDGFETLPVAPLPDADQPAPVEPLPALGSGGSS